MFDSQVIADPLFVVDKELLSRTRASAILTKQITPFSTYYPTRTILRLQTFVIFFKILQYFAWIFSYNFID